MAFYSMQELIETAEKKNIPLWKAAILDHCADMDWTEEKSWNQMQGLWTAMQKASDNYNGSDRSSSGLTGGDGQKLINARKQLLAGEFMGQVMIEAVKMGECNACMKRIVAAPTAGSCGVLPAVLITMQKQCRCSNESIIQALFVSGVVGQVIASRAFIAGAAGGCQAEVGVASAMAAVALVVLQNGTLEMCAHACSFALENLMGLVCDPVAGLVELPCVRRNVIGALNAVSCADMALAGMTDPIPCDEVIDAMREVGESLPSALRETGKGGIAATPTARQIYKKLNN